MYYLWLKPCSKNKLDPKSKPCIFLGYSTTQSAFLCYNTTANKIYLSRHVDFIENVFPFATSHLPSSTSSHVESYNHSFSPPSILPQVNSQVHAPSHASSIPATSFTNSRNLNSSSSLSSYGSTPLISSSASSSSQPCDALPISTSPTGSSRSTPTSTSSESNLGMSQSLTSSHVLQEQVLPC